MASCISCKKDAKYYCGKCMRVKYCGSSCQSKHFKHHNKLGACVPFYFIAGQTTKRTADQEKEDEEKAESAYVKLFAAYRRNRDDTLIPQLEEWYGRMSEEARRRYRDNLPCHDDTDPLSQDSIASLEPDNRFYLMANNVKYCFNLDLLVGYVNSRETRDPDFGVREGINPITRQPFSEEDLNRLRDAKSTRLPTLWEKVRKTQDVVVLEETLDTLLNMYRVKPYFVADAKKIRLKKELEETPFTTLGGKLSLLIRNWPILYMLGLKIEQVFWRGIEKDDISRFYILFKDKNELRGVVGSNIMTGIKLFIKKNNDICIHLLRHFFPEEVIGLDPFDSLKNALREYMLEVGYNSWIIIPLPGETIRDAYSRYFMNHSPSKIPDNRRLVNKTWLKISSYWGGSDSDPETTTEYELPWPGDPFFGSDDSLFVNLIVSIEYNPPKIVFRYNFHKKLKKIEPQYHLINPEDFMRTKEEFKQKWNPRWPTQWENINPEDYVLTVSYFLGDRNVDTPDNNIIYDIITPPYELIRNTMDTLLSNNNAAGPSVGENVEWDVEISIKPNLDKVYKKGIKYLAKKWKYYKDVMGLDYKDFDWEIIEFKKSEGDYWMSIFETINDLELALNKSLSFKYKFGFPSEEPVHEFWEVAKESPLFKVLGHSNPYYIMTQELEKARDRREYLKKYRRIKFFITFSILHKTTGQRLSLMQKYPVIVNHPENLRAAYEQKFQETVRDILPANYIEKWIRVESRWSDNLSSPVYGVGITLPWAKYQSVDIRKTEQILNVLIETGPHIWISYDASKGFRGYRPQTFVHALSLFTDNLYYDNIIQRLSQQWLGSLDNNTGIPNYEMIIEVKFEVQGEKEVVLERIVKPDISSPPFSYIFSRLKITYLPLYNREQDARYSDYRINVIIQEKQK